MMAIVEGFHKWLMECLVTDLFSINIVSDLVQEIDRLL